MLGLYYIFHDIENYLDIAIFDNLAIPSAAYHCCLRNGNLTLSNVHNVQTFKFLKNVLDKNSSVPSKQISPLGEGEPGSNEHKGRGKFIETLIAVFSEIDSFFFQGGKKLYEPRN